MEEPLPIAVRLSFSLFEAFHAQRRQGAPLMANERWLYIVAMHQLGAYLGEHLVPPEDEA